MKELWVEVEKDDENGSVRRLVSQYGDAWVENCEVTFLPSQKTEKIIPLSSDHPAKDLKEEKKSILSVCISDKSQENLAVAAAKIASYLIVSCANWRIIPFENLIARAKGECKLIAEVTSAEEAKIAVETLELGTDGVLLKTSSSEQVLRTVGIVKPEALKLQMTVAKIVSAKPISTGARVCVDTCDLMTQGEGMLVGSQSAGLFLVEAEVHENPYVASRPFRVNAGSVSMYTLGNLQTTRYLQEFKAGDEAIIVSREGKTRKTNVGRIKIEIRPLILVEAQVGDKVLKVILQNAETIRLVTPQASKSVTELKPGDEVVVHMGTKGGRHFGVSVPDETVIEK